MKETAVILEDERSVGNREIGRFAGEHQMMPAAWPPSNRSRALVWSKKWLY
jgi:hypothetical protein